MGIGFASAKVIKLTPTKTNQREPQSTQILGEFQPLTSAPRSAARIAGVFIRPGADQQGGIIIAEKVKT